MHVSSHEHAEMLFHRWLVYRLQLRDSRLIPAIAERYALLIRISIWACAVRELDATGWMRICTETLYFPAPEELGTACTDLRKACICGMEVLTWSSTVDLQLWRGLLGFISSNPLARAGRYDVNEAVVSLS